MRTLAIFITVLAAGLASTGNAATFYVSNTGNDTFAGTSEGSPWLTLAAAGFKMEAGDTLLLERGWSMGAG